MLGGKALECFAWSAAHDTDEEFLRRYGARVPFMLAFHQDLPEAEDALTRLRALYPPAQ